MATPFQSANRTKSLFSMIDANRPQAAQQKLGGIMGSQSAVQNTTNAQQGENQKVTEKAQDFGNIAKNGYSGLSEIGNAQTHVAAQQDFAKQGTPVLTTSAVPIAANTQTREADNRINTQRAVDSNQKVIDKYANTGNALTNMDNAANGTGLAEKQLADSYQADFDKLHNAEKEMTQGNLGQLAQASPYEIQQQQLAQVLADRQSNIGKLKALYGIGYDSGKFGALDSNLLQGQFNDAQNKAKEGLNALENAKKGGERAREQYFDQADVAKGSIDKAKDEAQTKIGDIKKQIDTLNQQINNATGNAKKKLSETKGQLEQARDAAQAGLKELDDKANAERQAYNDAKPQGSAKPRADGSIPGAEANKSTPDFAKQKQEMRQKRIAGLIDGSIKPEVADDFKIVNDAAAKAAKDRAFNTTYVGGVAVPNQTKSKYSGGKP
jgi:DNA repair exonuclease SbcCD ATPase subunit